MIIDLILTLLSNVLGVLLAPLEVINIGIDLVSSIPVVSSFIQVIAYLLPWSNLIPLFIIVFAALNFKVIISTITALWNLIPFVR